MTSAVYEGKERGLAAAGLGLGREAEPEVKLDWTRLTCGT